MSLEFISGLVVVLLGLIAGAASDVQEDVKRMGDDDVDRELREKFTRPGSR